MVMTTPKNSLPLIKETLYRHPGISRTQMSDLLGLKNPSIIPYISDLLAKGLIREQKSENGIKKEGAGRKQVKLELASESRYVIGIELGPYATYLCLSDLAGNPVFKKTSEVAPNDYSRLLEMCNSIINDALNSSRTDKSLILGISVGVPGYIDKQSGIIRTVSDRPEWTERKLAEDLMSITHIPVTLENNTRARAKAAGLFLTKPEITYFAYLLVAKGIACPIMVNGNDISQRTAGAGEVDYTIVDYSLALNSQNEDDGRLISESSEKALLTKCKKIMAEHTDTLLNNLVKKDKELEVSHILTAYDREDPYVSSVMKKAIKYLGFTIGNIINVINPQIFYIDAYIMKNEKNRELLKSYIYKSLKRLTYNEVSLEFLDFNQYRGAIGSTADAIYTFFIYSNV